MRYLCPICRAPQSRSLARLRSFAWDLGGVDVVLCDNCRSPRLQRGDATPPFPWKRRAYGVRHRALMIARSAVDRRVRAGQYNPLDSVITRDGELVEVDNVRDVLARSVERLFQRDGSDVESPRNRFVTFSNGELVPVYADDPVLGAWIRQPPGTGGDSTPST